MRGNEQLPQLDKLHGCTLLDDARLHARGSAPCRCKRVPHDHISRGPEAAVCHLNFSFAIEATRHDSVLVVAHLLRSRLPHELVSFWPPPRQLHERRTRLGRSAAVVKLPLAEGNVRLQLGLLVVVPQHVPTLPPAPLGAELVIQLPTWRHTERRVIDPTLARILVVWLHHPVNGSVLVPELLLLVDAVVDARLRDLDQVAPVEANLRHLPVKGQQIVAEQFFCAQQQATHDLPLRKGGQEVCSFGGWLHRQLNDRRLFTAQRVVETIAVHGHGAAQDTHI
mmetsp:Transcript_1377/g.2975  ORF Transcript_1377/g.2975 Transcript_1377/m.2975 type:complete len:281 (-) Transcript_1377:164-1006(-)